MYMYMYTHIYIYIHIYMNTTALACLHGLAGLAGLAGLLPGRLARWLAGPSVGGQRKTVHKHQSHHDQDLDLERSRRLDYQYPFPSMTTMCYMFVLTDWQEVLILVVVTFKLGPNTFGCNWGLWLGVHPTSSVPCWVGGPACVSACVRRCISAAFLLASGRRRRKRARDGDHDTLHLVSRSRFLADSADGVQYASQFFCLSFFFILYLVFSFLLNYIS